MRYAASGHLVYLAPDATLMAARFDPKAMELLGQPVALIEDVLAFSISDTGKLFYTRGAPGQRTEFIWVTRTGQATPVDAGWTFDSGAGNTAWSLSPDGTRVALRATTRLRCQLLSSSARPHPPQGRVRPTSVDVTKI